VGVECSSSVAAEVKAIKRAIDIISSGALSRGGEKHLPLFQPVSAEGEAQLWYFNRKTLT
jgi:hypothetical protein